MMSLQKVKIKASYESKKTCRDHVIAKILIGSLVSYCGLFLGYAF